MLDTAHEWTAVRVPGPSSRQPRHHRTVPQGKSRRAISAQGVDARVRHRREGDMSELDWDLLRKLVAEFGFWPATTDPDDIERHRRQCADADAHHRAWLRAYGPDGSKRARWSHLSKARRT